MSEPKDLKPCVKTKNKIYVDYCVTHGRQEAVCGKEFFRAELAKKEAEIEVLNKQIAKQMTGTCLTFVCKCGSQHSISPVPMYEARLKAQEAELERLRKALEEIAQADARFASSKPWRAVAKAALSGTDKGKGNDIRK